MQLKTKTLDLTPIAQLSMKICWFWDSRTRMNLNHTNENMGEITREFLSNHLSNVPNVFYAIIRNNRRILSIKLFPVFFRFFKKILKLHKTTVFKKSSLIYNVHYKNPLKVFLNVSQQLFEL